jgi:hypothetical protein
MDVADRVFDLRNRVTWLSNCLDIYLQISFLLKENVEFCLLGDETDRLTKTKAERHDMEMFNNDLRKKLQTLSKKVFSLFY